MLLERVQFTKGRFFMYFDEAELIASAKHDRQAFGVLYDLHVERLYQYAYRRTGDANLAQDITAATFEKAMRSLHRYRYRGISFAAWLYRIARNEILLNLRKQRLLAFLNPRLKSDADTEVQALDRSDATRIRAAMQRLPDRDRDLLTLRFWEGLSSIEVAAVVGCSITTLYVRLHRALAKLRKEYEQLEGTLPSGYRSLE
jgi:RNA polymerase sigma-70 factor, ECF subfamily